MESWQIDANYLSDNFNLVIWGLKPSFTLCLQFNLGEQRIRGEWSNTHYYEAQLNTQLAQNISAFINYSFGEFQQVAYFWELTGTNQLYGRSQGLAQLRFTY
ncbi:MAG: hypothetical protein SNJ60_00525 [Pseudanabaenaceae cyanobacterium]